MPITIIRSSTRPTIQTPAAPAVGSPPPEPTGLTLQQWRPLFITTCTWERCVCTDLELEYAIRHWTPETTVASAVQRLKYRRQQVARGQRQLIRSREGEVDDES